MGKDTISNVADTAFWVAYFRAKESGRSQPLFHDPYAHALAGARGKSLADATPTLSRYTEWTVIARTVIIDRFITEAVEAGVDAVINLGAGLDARPYRMDLPQHLHWIEADYPQVIEHKSAVLASENPKCLLSRVAIDLADREERQRFLASVADDAKNVLILTEGIIPYLSPDQVSVLGGDLFTQERFRFWIVEYIHRSTYPYLQAAARHDELKHSPFQFFPEEWYPFFASVGWVRKETQYIGEIAVEFGRQMPLPFIAQLLMPFFPAKLKTQMRRSSGFTLFQRSSSI